ncbi:MAG: aminopeptidase [Candidatus Izemoplasmatales bacterium]
MLKDPRLKKLAETLVLYSVNMQPGENVMIATTIKAKPLVLELCRVIRAHGGNPIVELADDEITRETMLATNDKSLDRQYRWMDWKLDDVDCYVAIRAADSDYVQADVPQEIKTAVAKKMNPITAKRLSKKWVLLNYPTEGGAHKNRMSLEAYYDYIIGVSTVDYSRMNEAFKPLKELMERTDRVRLVAKGTDLSFSIRGMKAIPCAGEYNIPDGEIFTAPVRDSVNGTITYNAPSAQRGAVFTNVSLTFQDGRIVKATADQEQELLQSVFDTDEGARYVGEFAIGVNPLVKKPVGDTLYDEKIAGSIHFTPGRCYAEAPNGNDSAIHWDLVLIMTPEYGGGEVWFDGRLIRKDGRFVVPELEGLNPEHLA